MNINNLSFEELKELKEKIDKRIKLNQPKKSAGRKFAIISIYDLKQKVETISNYVGVFSIRQLIEYLGNDIKVDFDLENHGVESEGSKVIGIHTLPNGFTFWGMYGGGDWEQAVVFIVYWDGRKIRGYVPEKGNPWNSITKQAYGNDSTKDLEDHKKKYPDFIQEEDDDYYDSSWFDDYDEDLIIQDIYERITLRN